jgi:TolA-binding protein
MIKRLIIVGVLVSILYLVFTKKGIEMAQEQIDSHQQAEWAPSAQFKLGSFCFFTLRYEEALVSFRILRTRYSGCQNAPEALFRIADCHDRLGDDEFALLKYKEFMRLYPNHRRAGRTRKRIADMTLLK